jgi:hypothetical protein
MSARLTFLALAAFWVAMNVLLWQAEYGSRAGDTPVPFELVWRKILTAPDASSLSVYQGRDRMGYCEFSSSVGQQMATLDEASPPPEGFVAKAGYQVHLSGNVALGDFTNRLKFDGRIQFRTPRDWQEFNLKITSRLTVIELHSLATNQTVHVAVTSEGFNLDRELTFEELKNPNSVLRAFGLNFADALLGSLELPALGSAIANPQITWDTRRTRVRIGTELVPVYRLQTSALGHDFIVDVSTLGEILSIRLPGDVSARIDEFSRP